MSFACLPRWSSNFLPLAPSTEFRCCAPRPRGEALERLPADEPGGSHCRHASPAPGSIQGTPRTNVKMWATKKLTAIEFER